MISIIIPFKDKVALLEKCLESVVASVPKMEVEIILVNNNSKQPQTLRYIDKISHLEKIKVLNYKEKFNFSAINNFAAKTALGEYLLFLNNDTQVINNDWLKEMLAGMQNENTGVVGAKLFYQDGTIQHEGVMLESKRIAIHASRKKNNNESTERFKHWSAVTAACMLTKKELFKKVGGFDEVNLSIAYNDVDYCLKIRKLGLDVICATRASLYHFESASRGSDMLARILNRKRYKQFTLEQQYFRNKWLKEIENDPFYNVDLV